MNMVVRGCADLELQMNAMERIRYYTEVENEEYDGKEMIQFDAERLQPKRTTCRSRRPSVNLS